MRRLLRTAVIVIAALAGPSLAAAPDGTVVHHDIEARLDPESGRIEIADVVTVSGRRAIGFRLAPWLALERAMVDGQPVEPAEHAGLWHVALPDKGSHRIELRVRGTVPPLRPEHGATESSAAVSGSDGSYLPSYSGWFPRTDDDWIAHRLKVEVPAPYRAVATGHLKDEVLGATTNRAVFAADYPAEPPSLFAGPYEVQERRAGDIRIRTYFHPELAGLAEDYLGASARYLLRFQEQIGDYPYRDFHVISSPLPVGLGFPNLTYIGRTVLPLPFILHGSLAHEVLHNWWGNGVATDFVGGNWAEGLTTYMSNYALAADRGAEKAREMRLGWLRDYAALPSERDIPAKQFVSKGHDAAQVVGYNKVAFVFHMLKLEIGEAAFTEGLRRFWRDQRFRVAGWAELQEAFEAASGQDLAWFFAQWLDRAGAPSLSLDAVKSRRDQNGYRVEITLHQGAPAYRLAVPLTVETEAGEERSQILLTGAETTATLSLKASPRAVHLDAGHDLFRRLLPGETPPILRDVTLAADALTVIAAKDEAVDRIARQLAERLLDTPPSYAAGEPPEPETAPLLVIGTTAEVEAALSRAGLEGTPETLAGRGTARVWAARRENGRPLLAVAAEDSKALEALLRPLPHYGRRSYLVFEGRRATDTGTWPIADSPLARRLDG